MANQYEYVGTGDTICLKSGWTIAIAFTEIVHGGRGDYVEFSDKQICRGDLTIPDGAEWRVNSPVAYYVEWRTECGVKVYQQKKAVDYADYKVGMWYISPLDLEGFEVSHGNG